MPAGKHLSGKKSPGKIKEPDSLNENQARRLRITCQHIDRTLCDIENILDESASGTAFPTYIADISSAQRKLITEYIASIRTQLIETMDQQGIVSGKPEIPTSRAIRGRMYSIDIAAEEIRPRHMRGYGKLSSPAAVELERIVDELQGLANNVNQALRENNGQEI